MRDRSVTVMFIDEYMFSCHEILIQAPIVLYRDIIFQSVNVILYRVVYYERIPHTDPAAAAAAGCDSAGKVDIVPSESNYSVQQNGNYLQVYRRYANADKDVERGYDRSPYPFPSKIYDVPLSISLTCTRYFSNIIVNCNGNSNSPTRKTHYNMIYLFSLFSPTFSGTRKMYYRHYLYVKKKNNGMHSNFNRILGIFGSFTINYRITMLVIIHFFN